MQDPCTGVPPCEKLLRLDSVTRPGLPEADFRALFTICSHCRWIMTTDAFQFHQCLLAIPFHPVVIDLTRDASVIDLTGDEA